MTKFGYFVELCSLQCIEYHYSYYNSNLNRLQNTAGIRNLFNLISNCYYYLSKINSLFGWAQLVLGQIICCTDHSIYLEFPKSFKHKPSIDPRMLLYALAINFNYLLFVPISFSFEERTINKSVI